MSSLDESVVDELFTVQDWIRWGGTVFNKAGLYYGHGTDNPWDDAAQLVLWVISTPWQRLEQVADARLISTEKKQILSLYQRRISDRLPVPYLTGIAFFAGLPFNVSSAVLIPRSPIAELIHQNFEPWLTQPPMQILDLCTGSGCIGIACAVAFPDAEVYLSDISPEALEVAEQNIALHGLGLQVGAIQSDLFSAIPGEFDLIVTNPPYVDADDMASLPAEYKVEPKLALESGDDGLDFTRRLLQEAALHLTEQGVLIVEVGNSCAALEQEFPSIPFTWLEFENGGHGIFVITKGQLDEYQAEFSA